MVPTSPRRTASCVVRPSGSVKFKNTPNNISRTMNDVPETGSIPVSPITLTAIAPSRNVVISKISEKTILAKSGNSPNMKITIIEPNVKSMKIGICESGHSYHPLPSMYSLPLSPLNALPISTKMLANVFHIFSRPKIPPPTIAPIAMKRTALAKAYICTAPVLLG